MIDVASIERATVAAVAPARVLDVGDWQLAINAGTMRRAKSAAPLHHAADLSPDALTRIEAAYTEAGLAAAFRIGEAPGLHAARERLAAAGYRDEQPTFVQVGTTSVMAALAQPAEVFARPCEGWAEVFMGPGFDPKDGASRVASLTGAADAVFGAVREDGVPVAVGVAAFGHGWCSVHGMRTRQDRRGLGLAGRLLAAFGREAQARRLEQVFLQVEAANAPALALYRRAGFETAWLYRYWSR